MSEFDLPPPPPMPHSVKSGSVKLVKPLLAEEKFGMKNLRIQEDGEEVNISWTETLEEIENGGKKAPPPLPPRNVEASGPNPFVRNTSQVEFFDGLPPPPPAAEGGKAKAPARRNEDLTKEEGRCTGCGNAIFASQNRVRAGKNMYHKNCFVCHSCEHPVEGKYYELENRIYCEEDFNALYSQNCASCNKKIEDKSISTDSGVYHLSCFRCKTCKKSLMNKSGSSPYMNQGVDLYCIDDYPTGKRCYECGQKIFGLQIIEANPNEEIGPIAFHLQCFKCAKCGKDLTQGINGQIAFGVRNSEIYCPEH